MHTKKELFFTTVQNLMNLRLSSSYTVKPRSFQVPRSGKFDFILCDLQLSIFFQCSLTCSVSDMEQQTAHSSMIIAEITKIWLGIPEMCMHACTEKFLVASMRVTLEH